MNLPQEAVDEFKKLWREEYGEEIEDGAARLTAANFLGLLDAVLRPERKPENETDDDGITERCALALPCEAE